MTVCGLWMSGLGGQIRVSGGLVLVAGLQSDMGILWRTKAGSGIQSPIQRPKVIILEPSYMARLYHPVGGRYERGKRMIFIFPTAIPWGLVPQ